MRATVAVVFAVLLAGCSDETDAPSAIDTPVEEPGPRFIAAAPEGTILFSSNRHAAVESDVENEVPDFELYVVNPDGTALSQITDSPGTVLEPRWSPDGETLAFIWTLDGTTSQVWTSSRDGTELTMRRDTAGFSFTGLAWSPDGTQLAYTDNGFVHILDLANGTDQRLVQGSWPAWSTLGTSTVVVYTSGEFVGEGSQTDLRAIDPDGSNDRPIVLGPGKDPSELTNASEASAEPGTSRIAFVSSANGYTGEASDWDEQIYVVELIDANPMRTTAPLLISASSSNDHWPAAWSSPVETPDARASFGRPTSPQSALDRSAEAWFSLRPTSPTAPTAASSNSPPPESPTTGSQIGTPTPSAQPTRIVDLTSHGHTFSGQTGPLFCGHGSRARHDNKITTVQGLLTQR